MSDDPRPARRGPTVEHPTRHPDDTLTHVERINFGSNPADGTGAAPGAPHGGPPKPADPADYGPQRWYRLLADGVHDGVRLKAGTPVKLYEHEVGAHHEPIADHDSN